MPPAVISPVSVATDPSPYVHGMFVWSLFRVGSGMTCPGLAGAVDFTIWHEPFGSADRPVAASRDVDD